MRNIFSIEKPVVIGKLDPTIVTHENATKMVVSKYTAREISRLCDESSLLKLQSIEY